MPNAESRPNYCSLWSGSNLWNIWVNYLPPLARLRRVSWPWHALFMFNIIMKSPLCKLCNYFKWSYNNVRHLTGCSTRAKIKFNLRDARVHGGLSNPNLCILRICTMIQLDAGLWKFTELRQSCHAHARVKERIESNTDKKKMSTKPTKFDKDIFPSVLISNHCDVRSWGAQWPGPWPVTRRHWPPASRLSPQLWPDTHKAHISSHQAQQLRENKWIARFPCVSGAYKKFILIGSAFDD